MPYVIAAPCLGCRHGDCETACPVDGCIVFGTVVRDGAPVPLAVIDPAACIECGACVYACPVSAVFDAEDLPDAWGGYADQAADLVASWAGRRAWHDRGYPSSSRTRASR